MKYVKGDLVEMLDNGEFDVIIQGCNCFCRMKSGIAKQITERWPVVERADSRTMLGDYDKLGTAIRVYVETKTGIREVWNAYTQFYYGREGFYVSYDAIEQVFSRINSNPFNSRLKIGIPKIGCGLAGGDWEVVSKIIELNSDNLDITVVEYNKE